MRKLVIGLILGASAMTLGACSQETEENAAATVADRSDVSAAPAGEVALGKEIIDLGLPEERRTAIFMSAMNDMMAQMEQATEASAGAPDPEVKKITKKYIDQFKKDASGVLETHLPNMMDAMATAYAETFSKEELQDIRDFVATPSGQKFVEYSPRIMSSPSYAAANQKYMQDILQTIGPMRESVNRELIQYLQSKGQQK